jgi:hypothetical protein
MRTISKNWDVNRQDAGEIADGRIACLDALSPIFAKWVNLQLGIVSYERGWYPETEPSVLEHQMALHQLLLRFWVTDSEDCHFHEESLGKVMFSLARGKLQFEAWILYYKLVIQDTELQSRLAAARRAALLHAFRNWIGRNFRNAPIANGRHVNFNWNLVFGSWNSEKGTSLAFQCTTYKSIFWVDFKCEHFILHLTQHFW